MRNTTKVLGFTALAIAMFMGTLDSTIINIALPDIMTYFHADLNDTSWISTIYVLGLSVCMISAAKLADQFGRKKVMLIGLVIFGGSSALCSMSKTLFFLIAMRFIQGIGGAIITPIVVPMALALFGAKNTQKVAGAVGAITAIAAAGGPPIGGVLLKYISWQAIFYVNIPFALISIVLTVFFVEESYDRTVSRKMDWLGMVLLTAALFFLTFSLLKGRDYGWGSVTIVSMFIGSAVSFALFILTELKVKAPLVELGLFREYTFTASSICYLITGFGIVAPLLILNYFLQNALGYEALNAAYIVMAVSLTVIVSMPLGSAVAGRFGARPVNFCGLLFMAAGAFMLSGVSVNTSKPAMVADLIVFGFGLGFSCQSLVSSIKHLPAEKSGIGSGIVNAARQLGTCIGIALLVSVLNSNVASAKNEIKDNAALFINDSGIADSIKSVILRDINQSFNDRDNTTSEEQGNLEDKLKTDVKNALSALSSVPQPDGNSSLSKLYDGAAALRDGVDKLANGQDTLNSGIGSLSSGIVSLEKGSETLTNGLGSLNSGFSQVLAGAQTLRSESKQGIGALRSGIGQLDVGAQALLSQCSSGKNSGTQTVCDGVTGVSGGLQTLSSNLSGYVTAANGTFFLMIKSNPSAAQLLESYQNSLSQAKAAYAAAKEEGDKEQWMLQIQSLSNLVALYAAGTDPAVTNEQQFEEKLQKLAAQSGNPNVVSSAKQIAIGTDNLATASQKVAAQFADGGTYKNGVLQLAGGISRLNRSTDGLNAMQSAIDKLTEALSQLQSGSNQLFDGSEELQNGLRSARKGSEALQSGSGQLVNANEQIESGAIKIAAGIGIVGQQTEIQNVMDKIKTDKDEKIAGAFDKVFFISAMILLCASVSGLFTDKKTTTEFACIAG